MKAERAEAGTRPSMTAEDRLNYRGVAQHPLARRWMLNRLIEAREKEEAATDKATQQRWATQAKRVALEMRRCGFKLEDEK